MNKTVQRMCIASAFAGIVAGALVTRYAPECREGFCWGQSPFLLMLLAGALTGLAAGSRTSAQTSQAFAGPLAGALVGLCVSFGGGLYAFTGGSTAFARPAPPTLMALVPSPTIGVIGGILGLVGAAIVALVRRSLGLVRRPN